MKAFFGLVIVACLAAICYFGYMLYGDQAKDLLGSFFPKKEVVPVGPPPKTPEQLATEMDERAHTLRMELVGELRNFQGSYDYRTGGWGGGAGAGAKTEYSEEAPEDAFWIAHTNNPKLKRARMLQLEIKRLELEAGKQRARIR